MHSEGSESSRLYEFLAWLEVNKQRVLIGAAALLGLIVLMYVVNWMAAQTERRANAALLAIETDTALDADASVAGSDAFLRVAREYSSTGAGKRALLLAATSLFASDQYDAAQLQYEDFLRKNGNHPLAGSAALGVAACLDAQNKTDAALSSYQRYIDDYPTDAFVPRAKLAMAAIHELSNQPREALNIYDELGKPQIYGAAAMEAMTRREQLLEKHPELAPTNAPPVELGIPEITSLVAPTNTTDTTNRAAATDANSDADTSPDSDADTDADTDTQSDASGEGASDTDEDGAPTEPAAETEETEEPKE